MKPPKRKRVSETFVATVQQEIPGGAICVNGPEYNTMFLSKEKFRPGARVRVKVTKLERGK